MNVCGIYVILYILLFEFVWIYVCMFFFFSKSLNFFNGNIFVFLYRLVQQELNFNLIIIKRKLIKIVNSG